MTAPANPTAAEFLVAFPEFTGAQTALIDAKISHAAQRTDWETWGDLWTLGVMTRAADLLAKSPGGRPMQIDKQTSETQYATDLRTMTRRVSSGYRYL